VQWSKQTTLIDDTPRETQMDNSKNMQKAQASCDFAGKSAVPTTESGQFLFRIFVLKAAGRSLFV